MGIIVICIYFLLFSEGNKKEEEEKRKKGPCADLFEAHYTQEKGLLETCGQILSCT